MATRGGGDAGAASYESDSSASSDDGVIITKKHRKKLQLKQALKPKPEPSAPTPTSAKPDHICGVCEREGGDLVVCIGSCVSAFHLACLQLPATASRDAWKCPSCVAGTHVCFHCKQKGVVTSESSEAPAQEREPLREVVKCRALSCGKFYHQDCIATLPLARIAGSRFICPLHTCAACEQSGGAKKEPVRCTRCPVAYHTSCLPRSGVTPLPGKRIICPKHEGDAPIPPPPAAAVKEEAADEDKGKNDGGEPKAAPALKRVASADALSVAASSPRTEENDDDAGDAKKHASKKDKKDKKKKKKKRKKDKKRGREDDKDDKKSKKSTKSSKAEDDEDADNRSAATASEDELEEKEAAVVVKQDPQQGGQTKATSDPASASVGDKREAEEDQPSSVDEVPDKNSGEELKPPVSPQPVAVDSSDDVQEHISESAPETSSETVTHEEPCNETTERVEHNAVAGSPTAGETRDRVDSHEEEELEPLRVEIPPPTGSMGKGTASDGDEGDEDSGSGSQSAKGRSSGRSAAEVAKEKLGNSSRSKKSKKKRKGRGDERPERGDEEGDEGQPKDEAKWVQCDECKKWRTVPKEVDLDAMPETWYCKMNSWNKAFASCEVPEEVVETKKIRPSKRASGAGEVSTPAPKKAKLTKQSSAPDILAVEATVAAGDAAAGDKDKSKQAKKPDKDSKKRKLKLKLKEKYGEVNWVQCDNKNCGKWRVVPSSANTLPTAWYCSLNTWAPELASCSAPNPPEVEAYLSKSQSKKPSSARPAKRLKSSDSAQDLSALPPNQNPESSTKQSNSKPSKKTSTPTAHFATATIAGVTTSSSQSSGVDDARSKIALAGVKSVVLEWAQCEKCLKWRKLPAHIKSSTLPDKWYCSMNHWDPSRASCSLPQEEDQEPVDASPLPSSQNWYPMPGQVGGSTSTGGASVRSKRGKLSYSELLYASTGQLRKTYTSDSSTLSFEYEGVMYHRDNQYKKSSMYVSPLTTNKITGEQIEPQSEATKVKDTTVQFATPSAQAQVDQVAKSILSRIDLRREFAITEIVDGVVNDTDVASGDVSLSIITTAIAQLVSAGEIEKVDRINTAADRWRPPAGSSSTSILLASLSSQPAFYRKVPKRPLKALKAWKLARI